MLHGKIPREFDEISLQENTTNNHIKHILDILLDYSPTLNTLSKKKQAIRRVIRKPSDMPLKHFVAQLTKINNFLPLFPGSDASKNIPPEELNEIILHAVPNGWENQSYL